MAWKPAARMAQMQQAKLYYQWNDLPKASRQAALLYPNLASKEVKQMMAQEIGTPKPKAVTGRR